MPTIIIASLQSGEGRTATAAGLAACLSKDGRSVRLMRIRSATGADAPAEDDARAFSLVPGCESSAAAITEQDAQASDGTDGLTVIKIVEAPAGPAAELASKLSARAVLVTAQVDEQRVGDLASEAEALGDALLGVIVTRQAERVVTVAQKTLEDRGLRCLAVLPENRLLAGPTPREIAETLHASRLVDAGEEDEAVEFVMLGPVSADPGQPYFLQHGAKAVVNRFDKMDLHLAALATEPDCLILTGGQQPSPYLLDRLGGGDTNVTVLLSPEDTVRTVELVDELYGRTRFFGRRKVARASELVRKHVDITKLASEIG
ncbi:MAG: hypothetical protein IH866_03145 [Chloroflexi bacterium]|nr:hypothetical protein [Chloroflexota bacterium]